MQSGNLQRNKSLFAIHRIQKLALTPYFLSAWGRVLLVNVYPTYLSTNPYSFLHT